MSDPDDDALQRALNLLGEYFDSVQIFVTRQEVEGKSCETSSRETGQGNWYARYGQVTEWMEMQHERGRAFIRRRDAAEE